MVQVPAVALSSRVAQMASTLSLGMSYQPGLLPRSNGDQAVLTGLVSGLNYGVVAVIGSGVDGIAHTVAGREAMQRPGAAVAAQAAAHGLAVGLGIAVQKAFPFRTGEKMRRAGLRSAGWLAMATGMTGVAATGVLAAGEFIAQHRGDRYRQLIAPVSYGLASAVAAGMVVSNRRSMRRDLLPPPVDPIPISDQAVEVAAVQDEKYAAIPSLPKTLLYASAVNLGLHGASLLEGLAAEGIAYGVRKINPEMHHLSTFIGHSVTLGALAFSAGAALEIVGRQADTGGSAIEAAYHDQPTTPTVSGGPGSIVPFGTLSREGRRVVNMALSAAKIEEITGKPAIDPIRAFVGIDTAEQVDERVDLLMRELEQLGAFERKVLCFCSPTGTGYINYVMMETLEYLTGGDCATFALQYSLRPSFISLDRVAMGREQNRAMLHALTWRLRAIPEAQRPRLLLFGESLGAHTMQDAFLHEGVRGFHRAGVDRALFVGSPAGSGWVDRWHENPEKVDPDREVVEVANMEEWAALPADARERAKFVLLTHHEDPITKFDQQLAVQHPLWLNEPRPKGVPRGMRWRPLGTFLNVGVDLKNATDVTPGVFVSRGHDYRASLAQFTSVAYNLPTDDATMMRIEVALRRRELKWATRRVQAEQLQRAQESLQRQLSAWGVSDSVGSGPVTAPQT